MPKANTVPGMNIAREMNAAAGMNMGQRVITSVANVVARGLNVVQGMEVQSTKVTGRAPTPGGDGKRMTIITTIRRPGANMSAGAIIDGIGAPTNQIGLRPSIARSGRHRGGANASRRNVCIRRDAIARPGVTTRQRARRHRLVRHTHPTRRFLHILRSRRIRHIRRIPLTQ